MAKNKNKKRKADGSPEKAETMESEEICVCGTVDCSKVIDASSNALECMNCHCFALAECLGMDIAIYDFFRKSANMLFVCDPCKVEAVPASIQIQNLATKVDKIISAVCLPDSEDIDTEETGEEGNDWSTVGPKKRTKPRTFAQVASAGLNNQPPIARSMAEAMYETMKEDQRLEKSKRTIVAENLVISSSEDDMRRAVALCSALHPNVVVEGTFREKSFTNRVSGDGRAVRPPILKIFLRSEEEKRLILACKKNLKNDSLPEWMRDVFIRPSLPLEERQKRDRLFAIAAMRNGWKNGQKPSNFDRGNRFFTWLNFRSEKYELRQVRNGEMVRWSDMAHPNEAEYIRASAVIAERREAEAKKASDSRNQAEAKKASETSEASKASEASEARNLAAANLQSSAKN